MDTSIEKRKPLLLILAWLLLAAIHLVILPVSGLICFDCILRLFSDFHIGIVLIYFILTGLLCSALLFADFLILNKLARYSKKTCVLIILALTCISTAISLLGYYVLNEFSMVL